MELYRITSNLYEELLPQSLENEDDGWKREGMDYKQKNKACGHLQDRHFLVFELEIEICWED